ncbi:hypothetical protein Pint_15878 [Pistacia integerrima]|uniref:Uncharacterized protein n=1 Tax=Pistacia integerrima TaxID=434235 RepID=A0ACC0ZBW9_9ROSI|nr:hypothetical protein Pint_15878 [Pistacia integerrima]
MFNLLVLISSLFPASSSQVVLLPLTHSLSKTQFTSIHHLLKSTTTRSATRFHSHHHRHQQVSLPLSPGSDYTLSFSLGNSNSSVSLYLDTGSDFVWLPCHPFECILCESKPEKAQPLTISSTASTLSCQSPVCSAAHSSLPTSSLCAIAKCPLDSIETSDCKSFSCPPLYYAYGDGSLIATLYKDSLSMPVSSQKSLVLSNFAFGCAHTTLAEPVGVAGFGRGVLSFPAQLSSLSPQLDGISVGKKNIPSPGFLKRVDRKGNGGMVVDSGTTFTMLPKSLYDSVVAEFDRRVGGSHERASGIEEKTGLSPCYYLEKVANVPMVKLHFVGNGSSVVLPRRNYFYEFLDGGDGSKKKRNVGCLMLMNGGDEKELSGGPGATLGNYQQQGFEVVYDLEKRKVGFARRKCASLWENLNKN